MKRKYVVGIDFGMSYSYIVYFLITEENGKITKSPIKSLIKGVANSTEKGLASCYYIKGKEYDFKNGDPAEEMIQDFLNDSVEWCVGQDAEARFDNHVSPAKSRHNESVASGGKIDYDSDPDPFRSFEDEGSALGKIDVDEKNVEISLFFATIFYKAFSTKEHNDLLTAEDVDFIIGSPPGCGKAYAEELKKCVKNGYCIAREKMKRETKTDVVISSRVRLTSACYSEPILAGISVFQNNENKAGLLEGESALVVDIGAGTADFAYVERVNGKIRAKKYTVDKDGNKLLIQSRGSLLGCHAGKKIDEVLSIDIMEHANRYARPLNPSHKIFVKATGARTVKEKLHEDGANAKSQNISLVQIGCKSALLNKNTGAQLNKTTFFAFRGAHPANSSEIEPLDFDKLAKDSNSKIYAEFSAIANLTKKHWEEYPVSNCAKIVFVGGSSRIDSLKDIITERIGEPSLKRCEISKLFETQKDILSPELQLNLSSAVAIGACLAYEARESLVVAPSLRMYIYNDGDRYEAHCLINNLSECMGPLVITSDEIEEYISDSILRVNFMEDGALVYKDGNKEVNAFDDETVSLFNLEIPNAEQRSRGVTFVDANGRELYDSGKPWPINQAKDGDYHEIKEEISINIRSASKADLIILPSKHGRDINRTYVYYLQKIKVRGKNDGEEIPLTVYDSLRNQEYSFKIESYDENGQPLALSKDEKAFNEKAKFHKSNASHTYYYVATKIGANNCKKVILDKILSGELVLNDADKEEFLKILNGNWKKEDK